MGEEVSDLKSVYLIYGPQELRLEEALARLKARLSNVADLDFNLQTFRGESSHADEIVAACNTLPFMSERRLVIVRDVDKMPKADVDALVEYVRSPCETTTLVLVAVKVDKRTSLYTSVAKLGGVAEYKAPKRSELPSAVIAMFAARGRSVGRDAAEVLVGSVGHDLGRLSVEVDKVIAFAGDARTLSRDDIEEVMSSTAATSVFEFLDALGSRDPRSTLRCATDLLSSGQTEAYIHVMAARRLRELVTAEALLARGEHGTFALAKALHKQEWQVRDLPRQAGRFAPGELVDALRDAATAEADMKTSRDSRLVLERWLLSVCGA